MKQKCESIIKEQLQEIRSEHGMKEYLTMLARFPQMGYENVLLLMHLFPEATMVCGKGAWKNYQADILYMRLPTDSLLLLEDNENA